MSKTLPYTTSRKLQCLLANRGTCSFVYFQVLIFIVQNQSWCQAESTRGSPLLNDIHRRRKGLWGNSYFEALSQKEWSKPTVESGDIRSVQVIHPLFADTKYTVRKLTVW